jgi:hypothetical protein
MFQGLGLTISQIYVVYCIYSDGFIFAVRVLLYCVMEAESQKRQINNNVGTVGSGVFYTVCAKTV